MLNKTAANQTIQSVKYGYLYNYYVLANPSSIANTGWKAPAASDFEILIAYLAANSAYKVRETGTTYWSTNDGLNSVGFKAKGAGNRNFGTFIYLTTTTRYRTTSAGFGGAFTSYKITTVDADILVDFREEIDADGWSIRLLKESTELTDGQTGLYVSNDGKRYRTICINNQEWLADNLCETKYRDGTEIPTVTDESTWAALVTGAKCAYNNDESNVYT